MTAPEVWLEGRGSPTLRVDSSSPAWLNEDMNAESIARRASSDQRLAHLAADCGSAD